MLTLAMVLVLWWKICMLFPDRLVTLGTSPAGL
jgi:hypothetical protein